MVEHKLHELISKKVLEANLDDCKVFVDHAPEKGHNLPLFFSKEKSRKTTICNVDILVIKDNKIKIIFEIEESNVLPTQVCGKFLASAISNYYIYEDDTIEMDDKVLFIQVLNNLKLNLDRTSKMEQWKNLEKEINNILPVKDSKITKYKLFFGNIEDFDFDRLISYLRGVLSE